MNQIEEKYIDIWIQILMQEIPSFKQKIDLKINKIQQIKNYSHVKILEELEKEVYKSYIDKLKKNPNPQESIEKYKKGIKILKVVCKDKTIRQKLENT